MDQSQQTQKPRGIKKLMAKLRSIGSSKKTQPAPQPAATSSSAQPTTEATTSQTQASTMIPETQPVVADTPAVQPAATQPVAEPIAEPIADTPTTNPAVAETKSPADADKIPAMPDLAIVIEVDDGEDVEEIVLPERYTAGPYAADRAKYERARAIFDKYNLKLEPAEWRAQSTTNILRVEKKPRMRVRWTCHACNRTFGRDKVCVSCAHGRCTDCIRYPVRRVGDKAKKPIIIKPESSTVLADMPKTGSCHECKTSFVIGNKQCENCQHEVCERCLKETIMSSPATAPTPLRETEVVAA